MTICVIQILALFPANDLGIFVTTLFLSTVTVEVTPVANPAAVKVDGMVKFFGIQSSIKKPMVGANVGSIWGAIVVSASGGSGAGVSFLLQAVNKNAIENDPAKKMILLLVIIVVLKFLTRSLRQLEIKKPGPVFQFITKPGSFKSFSIYQLNPIASTKIVNTAPAPPAFVYSFTKISVIVLEAVRLAFGIT